jgi:hypothetical protein
MEHILIINYNPEAEANAIVKVFRSEESTTNNIEVDFHNDLETLIQGISATILAGHRDEFQNSGTSLKHVIKRLEEIIFSPDMEGINILSEKAKNE